ncbi:MAG: ubiquinone biosynthesis regulatory protein kinase UbiB [Gammaproteobacteria bacterium]|nr:ubiquinone biosynthesis regulatory protein kinase UbiB [Gammaproteobacteria bacterium]
MRPLWHGLRILLTVIRFRLDTILLELTKDHWLRWLLLSRYLPKPRKSSALRLREAIEHLGPVFIKFGQILSTRRDLLPVDYADQLAKLQDQVPPFPTDEAISRIEKSLNRSLNDLFSDFKRDPIASASLAQVHAARLQDGNEVVVKVIRPDVADRIRKDLALIFQAVTFLHAVSRDARRLRLIEVVQDYEETIFNELDLTKEAHNTTRLRYNFADSELLYVPRVFRDFTTTDVLVLERIHGVPISATSELSARGTDLKKLAVRGVETFFTQVFEHNFFHADMHPGNIFIDAADPSNPSYIAVDCAIMGQLTAEDQTYLARNIVAFFNQDFKEIAQLHAESGWIGAESDVQAFEQVIRELCEPLFLQPLSQISFGHFLLNLFTTARQFNMEVQPQLVLLQKTLLNIEGLGRQLDPDLDLWTTAKPFMERWMQNRYGVEATLKAFTDNAPKLLGQLPRLPHLLLTAGDRLNSVERQLRVQTHAMEKLQSSLNESRITNWRKLWVILFGLGGIAQFCAVLLNWLPVDNHDTFLVGGIVSCLVAVSLSVKR